MPETIAAVDVGTNSLHFVVARTTDGERFEVDIPAFVLDDGSRRVLH